MDKHVFILGNNPKLSISELQAVLPTARFFVNGGTYVIGEMDDIDCHALLRRLGGTIKIGKVISNNALKENIIKDLLSLEDEKKIIFGISVYENKSKIKNQKSKLQFKNLKMGIEIKRILKERGFSSRFVTSKEPVLSSVVVAKNKCQEFLILDNEIIAKTCAVQEFEEYSKRDYGRPAVDPKSGMLPPKLAKIMINVSQAKTDDILLDPFCGSGTILQEAILLGYKNIVGCDISEKAVSDTKKNLEWLVGYGLRALGSELRAQCSKPRVFQADVRKLSQYIQKVDVIVTEPYLGPALRGNETREDILKIKTELEKLYLDTFKEFSKIIKKDGRVVIVMPQWRVKDEIIRFYCHSRAGGNPFPMNIENKIQNLGFTKINTEELLYSRSDQKVVREIAVFQKKWKLHISPSCIT